MVSNQKLQAINQGNGYLIDIKLTQPELETLQSIIKSHWLYRLQLIAPEHLRQFDESGIEHYHSLAHLIDHSSSWHTNTRVLTRDAIPLIKKMPFYQKLQTEYGVIEIADEAKFGWENMLWRLVRPGNNDVAAIHADRWFWDLAKDWHVADYPHERLNVWIAVHTEVGKNGLMVSPASHTRTDWKWHTEARYGQQKPVLDENPDDLGLTLLPLAPGDGVVFSHDLLHVGAPNHADKTRVSLEFTILVPTQN